MNAPSEFEELIERLDEIESRVMVLPDADFTSEIDCIQKRLSIIEKMLAALLQHAGARQPL